MEWTADSVGPGWKNLVQPLIDLAKLYNVEIYQIKEKFGGLRFYHAGSEKLAPLVNAVEEASYHTCEICGTSGIESYKENKPKYRAITAPVTLKGFWMKTLCQRCRDEEARTQGEIPYVHP